MPNPYFQFKQFTVYHDRCAMKVGTDGVLLASWVDVSQAQRILDIGTGSGLIALMLAQRSAAKIDAIEIDNAAAKQATENVLQSPWLDRIQVHRQSLQHFMQLSGRRYDLLVSNPPYFQPATSYSAQSRSVARQTYHLTDCDLLNAAELLLDYNGRLAVIYPVEQGERIVQLAQELGFVCQRKLHVRPKHHLPVKRLLLEFRRATKSVEPSVCEAETLVLEEAQRYVYTPEFIELIKDFYLNY